VLTNGSIKEIDESIDAIVLASNFPISIIFVTLGNSKYPVASALGGDLGNLIQLTSPTLKSSRNSPLARETVSLEVMHDNGSFDIDQSLTQKLFTGIMRQITLHSLKN